MQETALDMNTSSPVRPSSIAVVMSTYNGAAHVADQVESVLAQDVPNMRLFVRDDGSTDATLKILEPYASQGRIVLFAEGNAGVTRSFIELVTRVANGYDFVAFCDQDDIWHANKLSRALEVLSAHDQTLPLLYGSECIYCDKDMHPLGKSHLNRQGVSFATTLYENIASGNTQVMNQTLARLVAQAGAEGVYYHDWWVTLLASALGEVLFDDAACIDYRRTGDNVSPSGTNALGLLRFRVRSFLQGGQLDRVTTQLERLYALHAIDMPPNHRELLETFLTGGRLRKMCVPVRLRQRIVDELSLRLLFAIGRL